jgi:hypothetical protein
LNFIGWLLLSATFDALAKRLVGIFYKFSVKKCKSMQNATCKMQNSESEFVFHFPFLRHGFRAASPFAS